MGLLKPVRGGAEILPVAINEYEKATLPSSFRDPAGFLFTNSGTLYRQINKIYALVKVQLFTLDGAKKAMKSKDKSLIFDSKISVANKLENVKIKLLKLKS